MQRDVWCVSALTCLQAIAMIHQPLFLVLLLANPSSEQQQQFDGSEGNEEKRHGKQSNFWSRLVDQKVGRESLLHAMCGWCENSQSVGAVWWIRR